MMDHLVTSLILTDPFVIMLFSISVARLEFRIDNIDLMSPWDIYNTSTFFEKF